jgi:hypothetical protein
LEETLRRHTAAAAAAADTDTDTDTDLGPLLTAAERFDPNAARGPVDPIVLCILRIAVRLEGAHGEVSGSPWLACVRAALCVDGYGYGYGV